MSPLAAAVACSEPFCPEAAVERGRCAQHRRTTSERGYGSPHQRDRAEALPGARCSECGCSSNLQRDHRIPRSLGGSEAPSNKRWLCRCPEHGCHDRVGVRSDRVTNLAKPGRVRERPVGSALIGVGARRTPSPPVMRRR